LVWYIYTLPRLSRPRVHTSIPHTRTRTNPIQNNTKKPQGTPQQQQKPQDITQPPTPLRLPQPPPAPLSHTHTKITHEHSLLTEKSNLVTESIPKRRRNACMQDEIGKLTGTVRAYMQCMQCKCNCNARGKIVKRQDIHAAMINSMGRWTPLTLERLDFAKDETIIGRKACVTSNQRTARF
jgi:hypothetical protein